MFTLWVNSVFLSLLIANEGLRYWLFLSDFAYQFWGRVVVYLRPRSVCRHFWWLVAALLPGLSLSFAGGLSSPGLICCFAMGLRGAGWRSLWLCVHCLLGQRFHGFLACPSLSGLLWFCEFLWVLFSHMVHTLRNGVTPVGSRLVCPRSERRFVCFPFPFGLFLLVVTALGVLVTIWVSVLVGSSFCAPDGFRWCYAFSPSGWASCLCLRLLFAPCRFGVVSW